MRILIDIGHPAHVHLFKNFAHEMQKKGHKVLFTLRDKEFEIELIKSEGFDFVSFGKKYKSTIGKAFGLLKFNIPPYLNPNMGHAKFIIHYYPIYGSLIYISLNYK